MGRVRILRLAEGDPDRVRCAFVQAARAGQLLLFPTDTVYGLGGRADRDETVAAIYEAKRRPAELALPVLVGSVEQLGQVVSRWPEGAERLARRFWPGPLTLVLPRAPGLSVRISPGERTVGVRMPDHPELLSWLQACEFPLAVTSANLSGQPPAVAAEGIPPELRDASGLLLDGGPCRGGTASTVVQATGPEPRIVRPGPIGEEDILAVWGG